MSRKRSRSPRETPNSVLNRIVYELHLKDKNENKLAKLMKVKDETEEMYKHNHFPPDGVLMMELQQGKNELRKKATDKWEGDNGEHGHFYHPIGTKEAIILFANAMLHNKSQQTANKHPKTGGRIRARGKSKRTKHKHKKR